MAWSKRREGSSLLLTLTLTQPKFETFKCLPNYTQHEWTLLGIQDSLTYVHTQEFSEYSLAN